MASIKEIVGTNIKRIREEKGLSLGNLAELSDVSKSMLGQIERGESSPSITVLWKIAKGLKVKLDVLTSEEKYRVEKLKVAKPKLFDQGNYRVYPIVPFSHQKNFEMYRVEMESQARYEASAHSKGAIEYVTVYKGGLTLSIDKESYYVDRGETIQFQADVAHQYLNDSLIQTEIGIVVFYDN